MTLFRWNSICLNRIYRIAKLQYTKNTQVRKMSLVAVCQTCCGADKSENLKMAEDLVRKAAATKNVKCIFLPECIDFITTNREHVKNNCEKLDGPFITKFKELATELNVWISLGGVHVKFDSGISMTHVLIDGDNGSICAYYKKAHLFKYGHINEGSNTVPSQSITSPVSTPFGTLALAICFDLRFSSQAALYRRLGAQIITYPSAFTKKTGEAHWSVLLRARAIETQCYVVAASQVGKHGDSNRESYGHAMIIDPWGTVLADCGGTEYPIFKTAEINLPYLKELRNTLKMHPRYDLYFSGGLQSKLEKFSFAGAIVVGVFYQTPLTVAFVNHKPLVPGHILVAPRRPNVPRLRDLSSIECADLFQTVKIVGEKLESYYGCTSLSITVQDGPQAGQTVPHVHVHVLPRRKGDLERNDDIYSKLEEHDLSTTIPIRSEDDMLAEARALNALFQISA